MDDDEGEEEKVSWTSSWRSDGREGSQRKIEKRLTAVTPTDAGNTVVEFKAERAVAVSGDRIAFVVEWSKKKRVVGI